MAPQSTPIAHLDIYTEALISNVKAVVMLMIFVVSLFAVSFPALSQKISFLQIPHIVFFIGKHFGTGVILSTAFCHLLPDAFESMNHPSVKERWNAGRYTGMILLASLLSIFVIEYICTAYVDRLHADPSEPSSPSSTRPPSVMSYSADSHGDCLPTPAAIQHVTETANHISEETPLLRPQCSHIPSELEDGQEYMGHHSGHTADTMEHPMCSPSYYHQVALNRLSVLAMLTEHTVIPNHPKTDRRDEEFSFGHSHGHDPISYDEDGRGPIGKSRQVVGILVLQLGIMIHSSVIGLTLAITSGADFTTLVTAITFHQLFEGLSLGVRIAALPAGKPRDNIIMKYLPAILSVLFALTVPLGMLVGLLTLTRGQSGDPAKLLLTQGIMSAISAGMLSYAACVEMLAADFVMDASLWRSSVKKQAMALGSVLLGAIAMATVD